jgi:hypothetical protein
MICKKCVRLNYLFIILLKKKKDLIKGGKKKIYLFL